MNVLILIEVIYIHHLSNNWSSKSHSLQVRRNLLCLKLLFCQSNSISVHGSLYSGRMNMDQLSTGTQHLTFYQAVNIWKIYSKDWRQTRGQGGQRAPRQSDRNAGLSLSYSNGESNVKSSQTKLTSLQVENQFPRVNGTACSDEGNCHLHCYKFRKFLNCVPNPKMLITPSIILAYPFFIFLKL